jgi:hypothetical protein
MPPFLRIVHKALTCHDGHQFVAPTSLAGRDRARGRVRLDVRAVVAGPHVDAEVDAVSVRMRKTIVRTESHSSLAKPSSPRRRGPITTGLRCDTQLELQLAQKILPVVMGPGSRLACHRARIRATRWLARDDVERQPLSRSSSPGLSGRPSIPETPVLEPKGRGVLDAPLSRSMTTEGKRDSLFSRHEMSELLKRSALDIMRAQGRPGAHRTHGPRATKKHAAEPQV